ncbi:Minor extracellular protease Epr precursor [compost metagenome]
MPRKLPFALAVLAMVLALPAQAQLGRALPSAVDQTLRMPAQTVDDMRRIADPATRSVGARVLGPLLDRAGEVRRLLRRHPGLLDVDPVGELVIRHRVLAVAPSQEVLARIATAGFVESGRERWDELDLEIVFLDAPAHLDTRAALALLRELDPAGSYEFDHIYLRSGAVTASGAATATTTGSASPQGFRVGLIDSGVDAAHPALAKADVRSWHCNGTSIPDAHGTAVASLLLGSTGQQPGGGTLYAADIWCGQSVGGTSSALAGAMAWMAREKVPVINISLVGPDNAVLRRATQAMNARGHVLVAAVGNDGPAAPPLFPAAYPGVIGVTATDRHRRVLPEAGRGAQVDFAAPGSQLRAAKADGGWTTVRGTSFAAPRVAYLAARQVQTLRPGNADAVMGMLAQEARDAGPQGRDDMFGLGILEN